MINRVRDSRKLTGLALVGSGIIILALVGTVISGWLDTGTGLIEQAIGFLTGLGGAHQIAQSASDRAKWQSGGGQI